MKPAAKINNTGLLLSFSPWLLAIACALLLLLIALFTVSNYRREKELIGEALVQKGLTLMRFINSSVRESMRENLRISQNLARWEERIIAAMEQAIEQPGVESVCLVDQEGAIIAAAGLNSDKGRIDPETLIFAKSLKPDALNPFVSRTVVDEEKGKLRQKYQIVAWHLFPNSPGSQAHMERGSSRGQKMRRFANNPQYAAMQDEMQRLFDKQLMYIVQLDFEQFSSSLNRLFLQIVILAIVTLLVGIAGALSYMTLKGLRWSQQSLKEMQAFTEILVSSLPIGLIATDNQGLIRVCNSAASELLGIGNERLYGKIPEICLPIGLAKMFFANNHSLSALRQSDILLDSYQKTSKSLHLTSIDVVDNDGCFAGEVLLIRDLSKVKMLEKELQRSERFAALGKMAAGVAHELRNPLSSIKGLALLLKGKINPLNDGYESADLLVKEVERLNRSIGELLDYARPAQLNRELIPITEIIEKTVSLVMIDAESFGIKIVLDFSGDLPRLYVDRDKLNQVVLNLLLNAIQAMPNGGVLQVRTALDGELAVVSIIDSGVGISPENLQHVFDPYFTTKSTGTGLGLALSAKIIEEHGGTMKILSTENEYTEVRVALPIAAELI